MRMAGFVLVGGRSLRMRRDKALLPWHSSSLVEEVASGVASAAGNVALVGDPRRYSHLGFDCLPDLRPGLGPLAGLEAALQSQRGELNLVVACDMPGLESTLLARLLHEADASGAECVVAREVDGTVHPLCAVYRSSCLTKVREALDAGQLQLFKFLNQLSTVTIEADRVIWNVNTPEEWNVCQLRDIRTT